VTTGWRHGRSRFGLKEENAPDPPARSATVAWLLIALNAGVPSVDRLKVPDDLFRRQVHKVGSRVRMDNRIGRAFPFVAGNPRSCKFDRTQARSPFMRRGQPARLACPASGSTSAADRSTSHRRRRRVINPFDGNAELCGPNLDPTPGLIEGGATVCSRLSPRSHGRRHECCRAFAAIRRLDPG